jgi:transcriptional regulator with XRE-family HTH domain
MTTHPVPFHARDWTSNLQAVPGQTPRAVRVGARIKAARTAKGMSQSAFARALPGHVADSYVSRWERGINMPSWDHLEHIATLLEMTVGELVDDD